MKNILLFFTIFSAVNLSAQNLEAYFHYADFNSPQGAYIETYMSTIGRTAVFAKTEKGYQAKIEITMIFRQEDSIKTFRKYVLKSPVIQDSLDNKPNFIDVRRIPLEQGAYNFEIKIKDLNSNANAFKYSDLINIYFPENELAFSGIQMVESFKESEEESSITKNGIDMIPYVSNYFPGNTSALSFYIELYNSKKMIGEKFLLKYYIRKENADKPEKGILRFKRTEAKEIIPILGKLNIENLNSGNYELVVEALNKENEVLKSTTYQIQRSKPLNIADMEKLENYEMNQIFKGNVNNKDSLNHYINSLRPIAENREKKFIDKKKDTTSLKYMQRFFYTFWYNRNAVDPGTEWRTYYKQVNNVDDLFATRIKRGYETDRGRIYMRYGPPNDTFESRHEPSAYPYEIWSYYKAGNEMNKKFVFYNPDIAGDDYQLLHSNVTGELKTPNWERRLNKRNTNLINHDQTEADDSWGRKAREYFESH